MSVKCIWTQYCIKYKIISHASKIFLEIPRQQLHHYNGPQIAEEQFSFTFGKRTADAILAVRNINSEIGEETEGREIMATVC